MNAHTRTYTLTRARTYLDRGELRGEVVVDVHILESLGLEVRERQNRRHGTPPGLTFGRVVVPSFRVREWVLVS